MADNDQQQQPPSIADLFGSESEEEKEPAAAATLALDDADEDVDVIDNGNAQQHEQQMRDLFGSDDEDEVPKSAFAAAAPVSEDDVPDAWAHQHREDTPPEEPLRGPPIRLPVPLNDVLTSDHLRVAKLSNIIAIEPQPYDPETYQAEGAEYIDERGRKRVRLHDTNAIRWRWAVGADGQLTRESNARMVRWSDGSVTLSVGEEVMDVREFDTSTDHTYLFTRHSNLIQGQGPLTKKVTFRPASLTSGSHKRLAAAVERQHGARQQRVRATTTLVDPKKEKEDRERAEEARIKDLEKLADKQQKQMRKYTSSSVGPPRYRALNAAYLEDEEGVDEEEDEDDGWLVKDGEDDLNGGGGGGGGGDDEDGGLSDDEGEEDEGRRGAVERPGVRDEYEEAAAERRLAAAKTAAAPRPPSEQGGGGGGGGGGGVLMDSEDEDISEDDDEKAAEAAAAAVKKKKKQRTVVMMEESDSD